METPFHLLILLMHSDNIARREVEEAWASLLVESWVGRQHRTLWFSCKAGRKAPHLSDRNKRWRDWNWVRCSAGALPWNGNDAGVDRSQAKPLGGINNSRVARTVPLRLFWVVSPPPPPQESYLWCCLAEPAFLDLWPVPLSSSSSVPY